MQSIGQDWMPSLFAKQTMFHFPTELDWHANRPRLAEPGGLDIGAFRLGALVLAPFLSTS